MRVFWGEYAWESLRSDYLKVPWTIFCIPRSPYISSHRKRSVHIYTHRGYNNSNIREPFRDGTMNAHIVTIIISSWSFIIQRICCLETPTSYLEYDYLARYIWVCRCCVEWIKNLIQLSCKWYLVKLKNFVQA